MALCVLTFLGSRVCSPGWVEGPGSCCFRFISASVTWSAAKNICQEQLGGRLAVLDTYTKNAFIIGNLAILSSEFALLYAHKDIINDL